MITKKEVSKMSVVEILIRMYHRQLHENSLNEKSKEALAAFLMEIFNKGLLNQYLNLK